MQKRTKEIDAKISQLEDLKLFFEDLYNSKRDKWDNRSEKWQESDKGQEEDSDIGEIEELASDIESAMEKAQNIFTEE